MPQIKKRTNIWDCSLLTFPRIQTKSGAITALNNLEEVPFSVERVFFLYDIPGGESRGAHAHKQCHQILIAASGAFEVLLDDGKLKRQVLLNRPYLGLHIPPGIWAAEVNFSSGAICLVLASHIYDENDYIRNYEKYLHYISNG